MTTYYRVADWHENFETSETKKLKVLKWVPLPNKQDGDGYTLLLDHEKGPAHFGCWTAMLQLASKCELRGSFLRKIGAAWVPHDADSISRITRMPKSLVLTTVKRLLEIGWLEELSAFPATSPEKTAAPPGEPVLKGSEGKGSGSEVKGMEGNGSEGPGEPPKATTPQASLKGDRTTTRKTWAEEKPEDFKMMMAAFEADTARAMDVAVYFRVKFHTKKDGDIHHEWERRFTGMMAAEVFLIFANEPAGMIEMPSQFDNAKRRFLVSEAQ